MEYGFNEKKLNNEILRDCLITFCFLLSSILLETITFLRLGFGCAPKYIGFNVVFWVSVVLFFAAFPAIVKVVGFSIILILQLAINFINTSYFYVNGNLFDLETTLQAKNGIQVATPDVFDLKIFAVMLAIVIITVVGFILIFAFLRPKKGEKIKRNVIALVVVLLSAYIVGGIGNNIAVSSLKTQKYNFDVWSGVELNNAITSNDVKNTANTLASEKYLYDNLDNKFSALKKFGTLGYYSKNFLKILDGTKKADENSEIEKTIRYINNGGLATIQMGTSGGNNCITILLESASWWGIDPYTTPTLYALSSLANDELILNSDLKFIANNTLKLKNYYSRSATNVSEQLMVVGSFPTTNTPYYKLYSDDVKNMNFNYSLPNLLKQINPDISTTYIHPSTKEIYMRHITMDAFGFDKAYFLEDMEGLKKKPDNFYNLALDNEFFDAEIDRILPDTESTFYTHITSLTTHGSYLNKDKTNTKNLMPFTEKLVENYDKVLSYYKDAMPDLHFPQKGAGDFYTEFINYKSAYMSLDKGLEILFKTLKQKNLLENTTICMFSDHYAYYNDISLQIYGYKHSDFVHPELYNIPAFIFDTKLANKLTSNHTNNQKLYDTSFALPESLLPTLLDVLDINYNPSYYLGVSIWDENNNHNVQISYLGGVLNENFFSWDVFTIENPYDYTELDYLGKRYQFFCDSIYKYTKAKFLDNMYTYNEKIFNQIKVV